MKLGRPSGRISFKTPPPTRAVASRSGRPRPQRRDWRGPQRSSARTRVAARYLTRGAARDGISLPRKGIEDLQAERAGHAVAVGARDQARRAETQRGSGRKPDEPGRRLSAPGR
jgi:hypothetical protein